MIKKRIITIGVLFFTLLNIAQVSVLRVIDGDTIELTSGEKVRLIGINAPEMKDKYGFESKEYLIELIENKSVLLKSDPIANDKDIYGRLLRYIYLQGEDINKKLIQNGFAFAYLKYPFSKRNEYEQIEQIAKNEKIGVWKEEEINYDKNREVIYYFIGLGILILLAFLIYYLKK